MIDLQDRLKLIIRNVYEKKGRVFLTITGIVIGIFVFTFFIFVSQGLKNAITEQFTSFGLNTISVVPVGAVGDPSTSPGGLTDTHIEKIKKVVKDYDFMVGQIFYNGQYEYGRQTKNIISLATPEEFAADYRKNVGIEFIQGRDIEANDKSVAVLGYKTATSLFGENNPIKIGSSLKIQGKSLRVIGIIKERGDLFVDNALIMSFDDIKELSGKDTYSVVQIALSENADVEEAKKNINRVLNPNGNEKNFDIQSSDDNIEQFNMIIGLLTAIISFISSVALVVGGINVLNTMYTNVLERVNEISVMKAIGATNEDIRSLYLMESGLLGLLGSLIGFMMAFILAQFLSYVITNYAGYNVPIYFNLTFFISVILITVVLSVAFGTYPAILAAKTSPGDVLRDE